MSWKWYDKGSSSYYRWHYFNGKSFLSDERLMVYVSVTGKAMIYIGNLTPFILNFESVDAAREQIEGAFE